MKNSNKTFLGLMTHPKIMFLFLIVSVFFTFGHILGAIDSKDVFLMWVPFSLSLMCWRISEGTP